MATIKYFRCANCKKTSTAGEWNSSTLDYCVKNKSKMLVKIQHAGNSNKLSYVCPVCDLMLPKSAVTPRLASDEKSIAKKIYTWEELAECKSATHRLEIDLDACNGWISKKGSCGLLSHYLSTHTFYGSQYKEATKLLQSCGFDVEIANWDDKTMAIGKEE
jgi:hypothetical protein